MNLPKYCFEVFYLNSIKSQDLQMPQVRFHLFIVRINNYFYLIILLSNNQSKSPARSEAKYFDVVNFLLFLQNSSILSEGESLMNWLSNLLLFV